MKYFFVFISIFTLLSCKSQQEITATKNKQGDLIGFTNKASFLQSPYNTWFTKNYDLYQLDKSAINSLKEHLNGVTIKGFMGTWCGDSKRETPHFYKVLEAADFNFKNLELITVNRSKKTPDNLQENYNIIRVPTFIFYKDGKEIGRYNV
jgi:thiol-disulfide isomerase/thioredoxin